MSKSTWCALFLTSTLLILALYIHEFLQLIKTHDEYQRELDIANARLKRLQAENEYDPLIYALPIPSKISLTRSFNLIDSLLLDAMNLALPSLPGLNQYISPPHYPYDLPPPPSSTHQNHNSVPSAGQQHPADHPPHTHYSNGNGNTNGDVIHRYPGGEVSEDILFSRVLVFCMLHF
jgi:hypothetical protein